MFRQTLVLIFCFAYLPAESDGQTRNEYEALVLSHNDYSTYGLYSQSYDSSRSFYEKLISKCEKFGYWDLAIGALNFLAYIADLNQHYDDMEVALEKGRIVLQEHKNYLDSTDSLYTVRSALIMQIALYYSRINKLEDAEQILLSLIEQLKEKTGIEKITIFNVYARMADLYGDRGLYEKAYPYYLLMEKAIPEDESRDYYRFLLRQYMSTYYINIKDYYSARQTLQYALDDLRHRPAEGEWLEYFTTYYELMGTIYRGLYQYDSAIESIKKAVSLQDPHSPTLTYTYEIYGDCLANFRKHDEASYYYQKVDSLYLKSKTFSSFRRAQNLSKLSEARFYLNDYKGALRTVQLAFYSIHNDSAYLRNLARNPKYSSIQPDKVLIKLLIVKSGSLSQLSKTRPGESQYLKASLETYKLAAQIIDKFRHEISTDDFKQFFVSDIRPMYENAVNTCWLAWQNNKNDSLINLALYFMEKSKYQVLLDAIKTDLAEEQGTLPEGIIGIGHKFKNDLVSLHNLISKLKSENEPDSFQLSNARLELAQTQNSYEAYLRKIEQDYPSYYNFKFNSDVPRIHDLKKNLGKTVLIEYMTGKDFIATVGINSQKSFFRIIPADSGFDKGVSQLLIELRQDPQLNEDNIGSSYRSYVNNAFYLYNLLFKPVKNEFRSSDRFLLITDGILNLLPFDILLESPANPDIIDYVSLDYLLKSSTIHYEYSASILLQNQYRQRSAKISENYAGFSPKYSPDVTLRKIRVPGKETSVLLLPLKYSNIEVTSAASLFRGVAFTGSMAGVPQFKEKSLSARIIHFAGHTFINDSIPELSGLFFSETTGMNSEEYPENDVFFSNQILTMKLNANLVLLSACESGAGKLLKGEGLISIGRAFRYAGARSMLISLWKINDVSTSEVINSFCRSIRKGRLSDVALRNAKLNYIRNVKDTQNANPYYWAALSLIGDNGPVFNRTPLWIILFLSVIFLFFLVYITYFQGLIRGNSDIRKVVQP